MIELVIKCQFTEKNDKIYFFFENIKENHKTRANNKKLGEKKNNKLEHVLNANNKLSTTGQVIKLTNSVHQINEPPINLNFGKITSQP